MESVVSAIASFVSWIQMPAVGVLIIAFVFAGYYFMIVGGEEGAAKGKKALWIAVIGFIIVKLATSLGNSLGSKISF